MGHFAQGFLVVTMFLQTGEKFWHPRDITELQRYGSPIKIGAQGDMLDPDAFDNIVDVAQDFTSSRPASLRPEPVSGEWGNLKGTPSAKALARLQVMPRERRPA